MAGLQVHLLRFRAEVVAPLTLPPAAGAALRGALFGTLRRQFCLAAGRTECGQPDLAGVCPVCFLLAPVDVAERRGRDVPRPYVLRPPLAGPFRYAPGQSFEFELTTFGRALNHFPYALLGVEEMGRAGLGAQRRGAFQLEEVWAVNPLQGRQEAVYVRSRGRTVRPPNLPVGEEDIRGEMTALLADGAAARVRLEMEAPMRLVAEGRLVKPDSFSFRVLFGRLLERVTALGQRYAGTPPPREVPDLLRRASEVRAAENRLVWRELARGSSRQGRLLPMGGLVGAVTLEGELEPFLPWLIWGTLTHVGKDAAMGNGRYRLEAAR